MNISKNSPARNELREYLDDLRSFAKRHFRWLTRAALMTLAVSISIHIVHPVLIDKLGELIGFPQPSITSVIALMLLVFLLERFLVLEELIVRPKLYIQPARTGVYRDISKLVLDRPSTRVDLIQFTGQRAIPFLRDLVEYAPALRIRMLIADPVVVEAFDTDGAPSHRERLSTTVYELNELANRGITIEWKHYSTPPTLSAVLCDDWLVAISWYYCFQDPKNSNIVRLRSRMAPAVVATQAEAGSLAFFARSQFDALWHVASPSKSPLTFAKTDDAAGEDFEGPSQERRPPR